MPAKKKRRVFVDDDNVTLDCPCYAGGPDAEEAAAGVANILRSMVGMLMSGEKEQIIVTLTVEMLTDKEVRELPEL